MTLAESGVRVDDPITQEIVGNALASIADEMATTIFRTAHSTVVRDGKGRVVRNLKRNDFEIFEKGKARPILDFKASDQGPISLAILFDVSGSMRMASNMDAGKRAVEFILSWVQPHADEIALFTFDRDLRQETPFTNDPVKVKTALDKMTAIGSTSLYDAIGDTAKKLGNRPSPRRAVVVITDGVDTSSTMKPSMAVRHSATNRFSSRCKAARSSVAASGRVVRAISCRRCRSLRSAGRRRCSILLAGLLPTGMRQSRAMEQQLSW